MLGRVFKPILSFNGRAIRRHTVSASFTHSVLPASLLRLNPSQNFRLLPFELEALNKRAQNQVSQSMGNDLRNPDTWIHYVPRNMHAVFYCILMYLLRWNSFGT